MQHRICTRACVRCHSKACPRSKLANDGIGHYSLSVITVDACRKNGYSERPDLLRQMCRRTQGVVPAPGNNCEGNCECNGLKTASHVQFIVSAPNLHP